MNIIKLKFSKSLIDKAGEALNSSEADQKNDEFFEVLSNWRAYHALSLDSFAKVWRTRCKKVDVSNNVIVAQRLKRIPSYLISYIVPTILTQRAECF